MKQTPASTPASPDFGRPVSGWRLRLYTVIFEAETRAGRAFDVALIVAILASVAVVVLDSMATVHARHAELLTVLEWGFTALFTAEYLAQRIRRTPTTCTCHECLSEGHMPAARFCCDCGAPLPARQHDVGSAS